ncbi:MAG TPA: alpha/beta fold hydrolase [Planctomycetota bacterium]|nr:alpha/beta fold hydrolase [Planctomycetota bacterium]
MDRPPRVTPVDPATVAPPPRPGHGATAAPPSAPSQATQSRQPTPRPATHAIADAADADRRARDQLLGRDEHPAYRATGYALKLVESLMKSTIHVDGQQNLPDGPILFVCNHFTRFETFIVPYIIDRATGCRQVHSLASHKLFNGAFGAYLRAVGAVSNRDPNAKHMMVEELLTGRHNWVIYPEGSMIKDKKTIRDGRYHINAPDRTGPPHTGAAVMALQAEMYRQLYLRAVRRGDTATMTEFQERFHFGRPEDLARQGLSIVPMNITYYPIRPAVNIVHRLARLFLKQLPAGLEEELLIEGNLLFSDSDIDIHFGKPIAMADYLAPVMSTMRLLTPLVGDQKRVDWTLDLLRTRLTNRLMREIYEKVTINLDHLFCTGLRELNAERVPVADFHAALYLAARDIQGSGARASHVSLGRDLVAIVADQDLAALDSIRHLAESEQALSVAGGCYRPGNDVIDASHGFESIRLKNTVGVIANELEPLRRAYRTVASLVNRPRAELRARLADVLAREDRDEYEADWKAAEGAPERKAMEIGRPFLLEAQDARVGVVLMHGYLSAPMEVRLLAENLRAHGVTVYVGRLKGHGTAPRQLDHVVWQDWVRSYQRAYAIVRAKCPHVVVGGFSTGGLLALLTAARVRARDADGLEPLAGCFAINAPLALMDLKSVLVPAVANWNKLLDKLRIQLGRFSSVPNSPENPEINYHTNYVNGIHQLERLMDACRSELPRVRVPALIIQADHDPVVSPKSGRDIVDRLGSDEKHLALMAFSRHVIVRGEGCESVHARIAEFVSGVAARLR